MRNAETLDNSKPCKRKIHNEIVGGERFDKMIVIKHFGFSF